MMKKFFFFMVVSVAIFFIATIGYLKNNSYQAQTNNQNNVTEMIEKNSKDYNLVFYKKHCPYCEGAASEVIKGSKNTTVPTFFIDTESKTGRELVEKYHVRYASTIVRVRNKNVRKMIYAEKIDGKYMARQDVIKNVFGKE
ncbi:hypothetical protein AB9M75_11805 [Lactobacillus sp. AN1001]